MQIPLKLLHFIARTRPIKQIFFDDYPYIERFFLVETHGYIYYLHRMLGPDPDRDLHNHPWDNAFSLVLHGSYIERRLDFGFQRRRIEHIAASVINSIRSYYYYNAVASRNTLGKHTWHTIVEIKEPETWTLFWHSAWTRPWGFLTAEGFKPSKPQMVDSTEQHRWWLDPTNPKGKERMYAKT